MKEVAIGIFVVTYILLLALPRHRSYIAFIAALLYVVLGILPLANVVQAVDWNVLLMIAGTMGIVALFIESKMPALLAGLVLSRTPNIRWAIVALFLFSGIISAFIDNVATVLIVVPVALTIANRLKTSPVPMVLAISISSNLQGAATLVGDTTSILLGGHANLDFLDFFFYLGKPGMFWIVQAGAIASMLVLLVILRREKDPINITSTTIVKDYVPSLLLVAMIVLLILASFIPNKPSITNGLIATGMFLIGLIHEYLKEGKAEVVWKAIREIDYQTLLLLTGIFILIGGLVEKGVIQDVAKLFVSISGDSVFLAYTLIVWASVIFSAFIDNIPYVAAMLPVASSIATSLNAPPEVLLFGLLVGATLGGNLSPIGASANIAALGILRKEGHVVSTLEFMKLGVPLTLAAVTSGYLLVWWLFG